MGGYVWMLAWIALFITGGVIAWEAWRTRQLRRRDKRRSEEATREIYHKDEADPSPRR